jgi:hypothetical protein
VTFSDSSGIVSGVSIRDRRLAVGLSSGGVRVLGPDLAELASTKGQVSGPAARVRGVGWHGGKVWFGTPDGLHRFDPGTGRVERVRDAFSPAFKGGIAALRSLGEDLLCATTGRVGWIGPREQARDWPLPSEMSPNCLLKVAGRILVGTNSDGLLVLDTSTRAWARFGRDQGLSANQVTALEWVGNRVFVATPEGIDVLELGGLVVSRIATGVSTTWMTQVDGAIHASTFDGLVRIAPESMEAKKIDLPDGLGPEGDMAFGDGLLAIGCRRTLAVRDQPTFLGTEPLLPDAGGFRVRLPARLPAGVALKAVLRLPEWPAAQVQLAVQFAPDSVSAVARLPGDTRGRIQIDLVADHAGRSIEIRSFEVDGDRPPPILVLDPVYPFTAASRTTISGKVSGIAPLALSFQPGDRAVVPQADGRFSSPVDLSEGENRIEVRLVDGWGTRISREVALVRDGRAAELVPPETDTFATRTARIRIPFHARGTAEFRVEPSRGARIHVTDSVATLEVDSLRPGDNAWTVGMTDQIGDQVEAEVHAWRRAPQGALPPPKIQAPAPTGASVPAEGALRVIRYHLRKDETVRKVSERFYGTRSLDTLLIRWNGFDDSAYFRRMPEGLVVEVPIWKDLELDRRGIDPREVVRTFPWDKAPPRPKAVR